MKGWTLSFALAIATTGVTAGGHHSISSVYDSSRRVTIEGVITQFQLINPHPFLFVDVRETGAATSRGWRLEMDNRSELAAVGVTTDTFKPGDRVVVAGSPARTQPDNLYVLRLDRPADGFWYQQVGLSPRIGYSSR